MVIFCPACQKSLKLPEEHAGKKVRCPTCKNVFVAASEGEGESIRSAPPVAPKSSRPPADEDSPPPRRRREIDEEEPEDNDDSDRQDLSIGDKAARIARRAGIVLMIAAFVVFFGRVTAMGLNFLVDVPVAPQQNPNDPAFRFGQIIGVSCCGGVVLAIAVFVFIAGINLLNMRGRGMILAGSIIAIVHSVLELILIATNSIAIVALKRQGNAMPPSIFTISYIQIGLGVVILIVTIVAGIMGLMAVNNEAVSRILAPPRRRRSRDYDDDE